MESSYEQQFLAVYDKYADALFRHCYFRIYDRELAKDLVQEAFSRTWSLLAEGQQIENLRAFLYRVVHNLIIDEVRKKKPLSLEQLAEEGFSPTNQSSADWGNQLDAKEAAAKLALLEESYRLVVTMRFIDDLSPKEIASTLGISENVVSVRIHRGLKKLRQLMKSSP